MIRLGCYLCIVNDDKSIIVTLWNHLKINYLLCVARLENNIIPERLLSVVKTLPFNSQ